MSEFRFNTVEFDDDAQIFIITTSTPSCPVKSKACNSSLIDDSDRLPHYLRHKTTSITNPNRLRTSNCTRPTNENIMINLSNVEQPVTLPLVYVNPKRTRCDDENNHEERLAQESKSGMYLNYEFHHE